MVIFHSYVSLPEGIIIFPTEIAIWGYTQCSDDDLTNCANWRFECKVWKVEKDL